MNEIIVDTQLGRSNNPRSSDPIKVCNICFSYFFHPTTVQYVFLPRMKGKVMQSFARVFVHFDSLRREN